MKCISVLITFIFIAINPVLGLDFIEYDSASYYHGEMPIIKSIKADENAGLALTYITLKEPINGCLDFFVEGTEYKCINFVDGVGTVTDLELESKMSYAHLESYKGEKISKGKLIRNAKDKIQKVPLWVSLLPPLIAILLALIFREVIISLFAGVVIGTWALSGFSILKLPFSVVDSVNRFVLESLIDWGHGAIIIFSMLIGGMVAIISRNGGMYGIVEKLSKFANNARSAQIVTWFMGISIFFDDYANTLIVGNTLRPVTDKFKISREKLAYIVDSTAAPIAAIALVTTWIGAELGYIRDGLTVIGIEGEKSEYLLFLHSLKYSYYPVLTILFIFMLIWMQRDFGTMHTAEHRARTTGKLSRDDGASIETVENLEPEDGIKHHAFNAIIPILTVIGVTIYGLIHTGMQTLYTDILDTGANMTSMGYGYIWQQMGVLFGPNEQPDFLMKLGKLIGSSDSYVALLWASAMGVATAIVLSLMTKTLTLEKSMNAMLSGFKTMLPTMIVLILAWSLAATTGALHTADYLIGVLSDNLNANWMPFITFILAALISFSTGSSWSTMAILYPLALPLTWTLGMQGGMEEAILMPIFYNVISMVLAGSVLGDHCSPISDTTVLSSLASGCNHIDHVKTQMPYALTVGLVSLLLGGVLFALFPIPWYLNYILGAVTLYGIIRWRGKVVAV